jgi:hypothetical protein
MGTDAQDGAKANPHACGALQSEHHLEEEGNALAALIPAAAARPAMPSAVARRAVLASTRRAPSSGAVSWRWN